MTQVTVEEAESRLSQLIQAANQGEEVVITQDSRPVAKLVPMPPAKPRPQRGSAKGLITYIADDFDATPEDFKEYM